MCYFVLAQIGNDRFEAERTIEEFNYLENQMIDIFSSKNFPKLTFPKINDFITKADSKGRIRRDPANIGT